MAKFLLLTGEPGVGKSTVIRSVVSAVDPGHFSGFTVREMLSDGRRSAFHIETVDGRRGVLASVASTSPLRVGRDGQYGVELDFLDSVALPEIEREIGDSSGRIIVLDEIGPMQGYSGRFRRVIDGLLASEQLVIGTIVLRNIPWIDNLKETQGVECFLVTEDNRDTLSKMMEVYLRYLMSQPHA